MKFLGVVVVLLLHSFLFEIHSSWCIWFIFYFFNFFSLLNHLKQVHVFFFLFISSFFEFMSGKYGALARWATDKKRLAFVVCVHCTWLMLQATDWYQTICLVYTTGNNKMFALLVCSREAREKEREKKNNAWESVYHTSYQVPIFIGHINLRFVQSFTT